MRGAGAARSGVPELRCSVACRGSAMGVIQLLGWLVGLGPEIAVGRGLEYLAVLRRAEVVDRAFMHGRLRLVGANRLAADRIDIRLRWHPAGLVGFARRLLAEVGLASCRERVCPYV